jgi:sugar phosphate isomerase/epimerase
MTPLLFSVSYAGAWGQHKLGLVPFLEKAAALGYPAVMLGGKRPHLSPVDHPTVAYVQEIKAAAQRLKLEVATIAAYTDFTSGRQAAEVPFVEMQVLYVRRLAELGQALGAKIVRVFSGYFTELADHHADWTKCVTALRECAAVCADYGLILGVQNHHDVGVDVAAFGELLDDIDHPNAKAMFDPWSVGLHGADLYRAAKEMAPRMVQTTLADYIKLPRWQYRPALINYQPVEPPAVRAVPLGEGFLDLGGFFRGLKEGGFDGYVAYEICSPIRGGGSEANLDAAAQHALAKIRDWSGA